ncbi:MAG: hypothetical protein A3B72_01725 [Omnitrophica bacterium RIFCSPHIGHO2_02_FULL_45_28]|nr:MAG: hypothetical protein A3B72_01725 [Omnitrophica bacterium RIFCSPHIGHO2_02_FULL_45_28]
MISALRQRPPLAAELAARSLVKLFYAKRTSEKWQGYCGSTISFESSQKEKKLLSFLFSAFLAMVFMVSICWLTFIRKNPLRSEFRSTTFPRYKL